MDYNDVDVSEPSKELRFEVLLDVIGTHGVQVVVHVSLRKVVYNASARDIKVFIVLLG